MPAPGIEQCIIPIWQTDSSMAQQVRHTPRDKEGLWVTLTSQHSITAFVWAVWLSLLILDLVVLVRFGRNIPLTEDWWLVPPLTGNEPDLLSWLWAQNNEHRIPFPRLILLGLLKLTGGDWRIGMLFNIILLAGLAAAFIVVARRLRSGRSSFADTLFPITLLSLGNWENLYWSWQLTQVLPVALVCALLLVIVTIEEKLRSASMIAGGVILVLLPLCGANGLLWLPLNLVFFGYYGFRSWQDAPRGSRPRRSALFLLGAAALALVFSILYLADYQQPAWVPPNPGILPSLYASLQFLALGIGPAARTAWIPAIAISLLILIPTIFILARAAYRFLGSSEEIRAAGLLAYLSNGLLFALAMGYGRAGVIPQFGGWPLRYGHFVAPILFAAYFGWVLYLPTRFARAAGTVLAFSLLILLPLNSLHGYEWHYFNSAEDARLLAEIEAGTPMETIADRYLTTLSPWAEQEELTTYLYWLDEAGLPPFGDPHPALVTQEIRYHQPAATAVELVWGVDGWNWIDEELRPLGTVIQQGNMQTPMKREGSSHSARLQVPPGTTIDYGFLFTLAADDGTSEKMWEGDGDKDFHMRVAENGGIDIRSDLMFDKSNRLIPEESQSLVEQRFIYDGPNIGEVALLWGIDGWQLLARVRGFGRIANKRWARTHTDDASGRRPFRRQYTSARAERTRLWFSGFDHQ